MALPSDPDVWLCVCSCEAFHELRGISSENLMYIKEDLIIPHVSLSSSLLSAGLISPRIRLVNRRL